ncbi:MAG TPA: 2-amino-4-hydroxy-6-hydroxymethyldihydropteridine diphosphokinase [Arachidicoccus soli]|uniref:2-amino-4-hydroxy-6-hydroxymethyldihydropteridine pyrophosphokinase n=1 Tax=Arachidicoccus soli TaxID=2341117 RepID=A0A386HSL9_9BACT|nr:2-amino-4-hydroxy-6-hydroxymethyldihydropteridine diphosphokinase [Arachidicoccus soli]AYD48803.1 2-amino-4-hydroxy-6-hydroxymethyldihydropteridine diphosphokinase [Arachidicoccus soli]HEU0228780.1 2-amino-4-hydroxy-6-hydroxymethyldihydropteridine diphosphokinase [Arachidicoccus soli]
MNKVYLLIGGNMGNVMANLLTAKMEIEKQVGEIVLSSSLYRTAAWGLEDQPDFLNQVLEVNADLQPQEVLQKVLAIETEMGRIRTLKNGPRIIDIDILLFNDAIIEEENLKVPHPFLHKRNFTLAPLAEIASTIVHPVLQKNIKCLLQESEDKLPFEKL